MRSLVVVVLVVGCGTKPEILGDGGQRDAQDSRASLSISPSSADIGALETKPFTITNEGEDASGQISLVIMGQDSQAFLIVNPSCTTLSPHGICTVGVMAFGRNAQAELHADDGTTNASASLTSNGDSLAIDVPPIADTPIMGTSPVVRVAITNPTSTPSGNLTLGTTDAEFAIMDNSTGTDTCSNQAIDPGQTCHFNLLFQPTANMVGNLRTTQLTAMGAVSGSTTAMAKIVPLLVVDHTTVTANVSTCAAPSDGVVLTYTNPTGLPLSTFTFGLSGPNASEVQIHNSGCGPGLAAGASCTLTVAAQSSAVTGSKTATVHVTATQGAANIVLDSTVTATFGCDVIVSPKAINFSAVGTGGTSQAMAITVTNAGGAGTTHAFAIALGGTNGNQFQITNDGCTGQIIIGGASCTVQVVFKPTQINAALFGNVNITTPGRVPVNVSLSGQGVPGTLTMTPVMNQFPPTAPTSKSPSAVFTVKSTVPTGPINIGVSGPFTIEGTTCTTLTGASDSCTVTAAFAPAMLGSTTSGQLTAMTATGFASSALSGVGVAQLGIAPAQASLTSTAGMPSPSQVFTITNLSGVMSGPITLNTSGDSTPFTIGPGCTGVALPPGMKCTFPVTFQSSNSDTSINMTFSAAPGGSTPPTVVYGQVAP